MGSGGGDALGAEELPDRLGGLCTALQPVAGALLVEDDLGRVGLGVVAADRLDHASVARRALVRHDDAPDRILLATHAGQPESYRQASVHLSIPVIARETLAGVGSQRGPASCCIDGIFPCESWRIIFCIWPNCLTSWFTAWTLVPDPRAIRRRREPLMIAGFARSSGVIEVMMACSRSSSRSSTFRLPRPRLPIPGSIFSRLPSGPMRRTCFIWSRKSSSVNCCLRIFRSSSAA